MYVVYILYMYHLYCKKNISVFDLAAIYTVCVTERLAEYQMEVIHRANIACAYNSFLPVRILYCIYVYCFAVLKETKTHPACWRQRQRRFAFDCCICGVMCMRMLCVNVCRLFGELVVLTISPVTENVADCSVLFCSDVCYTIRLRQEEHFANFACAQAGWHLCVHVKYP